MKNLINLLTILSLITLLVSCGKDSNSPEFFLESLPLSCLDESTIIVGPDCTDADQSSIANWHCEIMHGNAIYLNPNSRCWIPQASLSVDTILTYQNADGELLQFRITSTGHVLNWTVFVGEDCPDGNGSVCLCHPVERIRFRMEELEEKYTITIGVGIHKENNKDQQELTISNWFDNESRGFNFTIDDDGSELSAMGLDIYDESRVIAKTEVYNVYTSLKYFFKYFYTQDRGLVGFEDEFGVEWVMVE